MTGQFGLRPAGRPGSTRSSLPWRGSGQYARASAGGREVDPGNRRGIEGFDLKSTPCMKRAGEHSPTLLFYSFERTALYGLSVGLCMVRQI